MGPRKSPRHDATVVEQPADAAEFTPGAGEGLLGIAFDGITPR
ncbi:hypothetical protein [Streptomyces sp. NPDC047043]